MGSLAAMPPRLRRVNGAAQTDSRLKSEEPITVAAAAPAVTINRRREMRLLMQYLHSFLQDLQSINF
jgi:hypothetical protein